MVSEELEVAVAVCNSKMLSARLLTEDMIHDVYALESNNYGRDLSSFEL